MAGLTFGSQKDSLRMVVDNGVAANDPRVMRRTNEATQEILAELIPVNGMMSVNVQAIAGGFLLLPKELENAIDIIIYEEGARVYGSLDIRQGWYDIVNPFTYVDPAAAHDNPLIDHFLVPDPADPTILRRYYEHPGIVEGTFVHITGAKRYLPITSDDDYLIVQNVPALKLMIQAIEYRENRDATNAKIYWDWAIETLTKEVKKHLMDPRNMMARKSNYEADLNTFPWNSFGWMRARLALEVPGAMNMGKSELSRVMERGERRLMERGVWKGCMEEFHAKIIGGTVLFPSRVEAVLAVDLCGVPVAVRSIFHRYLKYGPGDSTCSCNGVLRDEGEHYFPDTNDRRRRYRVLVGTGSATTLQAVCKLRWQPKKPEEQMTIRNMEAMRKMIGGIINGNDDAEAESACEILDKELAQYLQGVEQSLPQQSYALGVGDLGGVL